MKQTVLALLVCVCSVFFFCKTEGKRKNDRLTQRKSEYPRIIDSLGLNELYNETKWMMYCFQCDDTLKIVKSDTLKNIVTFGTLDLKFDTLSVFEDDGSIDLRFNFNYKGLMLNNDISHFGPHGGSIWGIVYANSAGRQLWYVAHADRMNYRKDSCVTGQPCPSRFINPLQPEVVKYINDNKTKLNPWFYTEAKRRGVLKE